MSLLQHLRYAFAHDPVRRRDRVPAGAVPVGATVELTLRVDAGVRGCVTGAYLEVLDAAPSPGSAGGVAAGADAEGADGAAATGMPADGASFAEAAAAARAAAWAAAPMEAVDEGFRARVDTSGEPRVLFYRFRIETDAGVVYYAARTDQLTTAGHAFMLEGDASSACAPGGFQLTAYDGAFQVPAWFPGSIMYQIFPDRFARGDAGIRWGGVDSHARRGWPVEVHEDWNEPPAWGESYDPVDFFGGTLAGIEQKLDYLASLGVEVVYLNPICEARSNHRYDTGDYEAIDPILGTWEDFERLAASARSRGMRLVLDTVLSHTGAASRYFNLDDSYDSFGAAQGEGSPYRSWYDFSDAYAVGYRAWWGDRTLPEVNERDASWQAFALGRAAGEGASDRGESACADAAGGAHAAGDGVLGQWMSHGASGLRLDVADEIPDDVLELVRASAKRAAPDAVIIGEVWEDPTTKESYGARRAYALGRSLDSVMNYPLRHALLQYALGASSAQEVATFLKSQRLNYPLPLYLSLMNLLSSHDVERVRSVLDAGREFRDLSRTDQEALVAHIGWEADAHGSMMQRVLATMLYVLPGVPCLYYGDERGMQGGRDPFDRATFPWDGERADCGQDLSWFYQGLGRMRRMSAVLRSGDAAFYAHGKDVVCILRTPGASEHRSDALLCVVNRSECAQSVIVDLIEPASGLGDEDVVRVKYADVHPRCIFSTAGDGISTVAPPTCEFGIFSCEMGPVQACVFHLGHGLDKPLERGLGVLCHVTSLPQGDEPGVPCGPGTLGAPARRFIDMLADAGARYWQILPLNPTDAYGSPYAGLSAFAGNTRLLDEADLTDVDGEALAAFIAANREWLLPYATFIAIKGVLGEIPWQEWPESYRTWVPGLEQNALLAPGVRAECARQYEFDRQWGAVRAYASARGIQIIGDMPIYVSADSADVWAHQSYFDLDENGYVACQGGVPPDQFAADGQLWGSPTYRWDALAAHGYDWWLARLERMFAWYDYVRIDHFLGFSSYYAVPQGKAACEGEWRPGPGFAFFEHAYERFGPLPLVAEDLGIITPEVRQLLASTGFPGMDVVLFADGDPRHDWAPKPGAVAFTGTHDTSTLVGWARARYCGGKGGAGCGGADAEAADSADGKGGAASAERAEAARRIAHDLIDKVVASEADVVIMPLQDILELDDAARMNVPGTAEGNWAWQAPPTALADAASRLASLTRRHR